MPTCCRAPRSTSSMNGSPAIWAEKRVHLAHSTQRSRSRRTCAEMLIGLGKVRLSPPVSKNRDSPRPLDMAWFWSGHSPPLSQTGQSSGWLISRNSMIPCCALSATSLVTWVLTTMPSATGSVQEACGLGKPRPLPASGMSTRHCRQAPTGESRGWSQNRGICTPTSSAARITSVFSGTETSIPSMVSDTVFTSSANDGLDAVPVFSGAVVISRHFQLVGEESGLHRVERAAALGEVLEVLVAEVLDRAVDRADRAVGECAERPPEDVVALVEEQVEVALLADALLELGEHLHQPPGALAARSALATGLVLVELGPAQHGPDHTRGLVEDLERAGAQHRSGRSHLLEAERYVEVLGGQQRGAGPAGRPELQLVALPDTTGEVDQLAQGDAERGFVLAGLRDVPGEAEDAVALGLLGAHRSEPVRTVLDDARHRRDRLHVVDDRRAGVEAGHRRERRPEPRLPAPTLQALEQGGLLAADVGTRSGVDHDVEVVAGAVDVLAEMARGVRLVHGGLHATDHVQHLAADVDERLVRADGERADDDALHEHVRVGHHQRDVLAGPGLRLVGVDHEVLRLRVVLGDERPLHPGREARAAAAAEPGVLDRLDDRVGRHAERRLQRAVAAPVGVGRQLPGLVGVPDVGEDGGQGAHLRSHFASSFSAPVSVAELLSSTAAASVGLESASSAGWPSPAPSASARVSEEGAVQLFSRASCRPTREAGPAPGPSSARPSG